MADAPNKVYLFRERRSDGYVTEQCCVDVQEKGRPVEELLDVAKKALKEMK